jgi:hypothetical protein
VSAAVDASASVDQDEIRRALGYYQGLPGRVSVMYLQEQGAVPSYTSYATTADELDQAARDIIKADLTDEPLGIYLRGTTVADGVTGRGGSEDTVAWLAFRADLDLAKPGGPPTWPDLFAVFERARLPTPTYWQHSGGGFYPTWMLEKPIGHAPEVQALAADIEAELRRAWQEAGYTSGVDSCHDAARVWRLAGSVHRKNRDAPITSTTGRFSGELLTFEQIRERVPHRERPKGWDGQRSAPRRATAEAFEQTYRASLAACRDRGRDQFRHTFFLAARNAHRMVAIGLLTPEQLRADLLDLVQTFWPGMGFNGDDRQHIHDALNNGLERGDHAGALASPWELLTSADEYFGEVKLREGAAVERQVHDAVIVDGEVVSSWEPVDLDALWDEAGAPQRSDYLLRTDGVAMFYAGKTHSVHGESESGKSWIGQSAALERVQAGERVLYVDYEDDARSVLMRMRFLGMRREQLPLFVYVSPEGPQDLAFAELLTRPYALAVIDGVTVAMSHAAKKSNDQDEYTAWYKGLPLRIAKHTGAAVVQIDHVSKSKDERGRFAIGSQAKMGNISGSAFYVDVSRGFGQGRVGELRIYVGKDRPGGVRAHAGKMRRDRLQPFARYVHDATDPTDILVEIAPWTDEEETEEGVRALPRGRDWKDPEQPSVPADILNFTGPGQGAVHALARFMRAQAVGGDGMARQDAVTALRTDVGIDGKRKTDDQTVKRAWGALRETGRLVPAESNASENPNGLHWWVPRDGDPVF